MLTTAPVIMFAVMTPLAALVIGAGQAANLQARFAATDLATDASRGRDLSIVVWSTTIGGVAGPLLLTPGEAQWIAQQLANGFPEERKQSR